MTLLRLIGDLALLEISLVSRSNTTHGILKKFESALLVS